MNFSSHVKVLSSRSCVHTIFFTSLAFLSVHLQLCHTVTLQQLNLHFVYVTSTIFAAHFVAMHSSGFMAGATVELM